MWDIVSYDGYVWTKKLYKATENATKIFQSLTNKNASTTEIMKIQNYISLMIKKNKVKKYTKKKFVNKEMEWMTNCTIEEQRKVALYVKQARLS